MTPSPTEMNHRRWIPNADIRHEISSTFCVGWWGRIYIRFTRTIKRKFVRNLDFSRRIEFKIIKKTIKNDEYYATEFMKTNEQEPKRDEQFETMKVKDEKNKYNMTRCECWNNFNGIYREVNMKIPAGFKYDKTLLFMLPNYIEYWLLISVWCQFSSVYFSLFGLCLFPNLNTLWHFTEYGFQ